MKIPSSERKTMWGAWFLAFAWNGMLGFMLFALICDHSLVYHKPKDLLALFFPAIGVALLLWAIRETVLWNVYGETLFISDAATCPWGSRLHGKISFSRPAPASMGRQFRLSLICQIEQSSSAGRKNRSTSTAWKDSHSVDIAHDGSIPVLFSLPVEVEPRTFIIRPTAGAIT
jgi:hypothetical protein